MMNNSQLKERIRDLKDQYPLHVTIFKNDPQELRRVLDEEGDIECRDPNGLTPLQLCSIVGNTALAEVLLDHGANPDLETAEGWSIVQECVASGNLSLAQLVLDAREIRRAEKRAALVKDLLTKLSNAPDFYCEMKWDFTSWVPLVARMCPSDTYRIYKSGPAVRIDSTLTGYDQTSWKRGNITFMFLANESGCEIYDINHDARTISLDRIDMTHPGDSFDSQSLSSRLSSPLTSTRIKTDNVEFWREKAGLIGFRTDKTEEISGYECSVHSTSGIEIVTRERVEHLTTEQRVVIANNTSMFESLLSGSVVSNSEEPAASNGGAVDMPLVVDETEFNSEDEMDQKILDYFEQNTSKVRTRPKEQTDKVQKFKARVWLSNNHPLSLQEQLLPIVELMSTGNAHFSKLKDFITLQLPAGFPVNIEIPLYHMINARITFSNINCATTPMDGVLCLEGPAENRECTTCVVDAHIFTPPPDYFRTEGGNESLRQQQQYLTDDQMLQFAIQQSMLPPGASTEENDGHEEEELTWMEALSTVADRERPAAAQDTTQTVYQIPVEDQFERVLRMSLQDEERRQEQLRCQEEEELARIIALSLNDK